MSDVDERVPDRVLLDRCRVLSAEVERGRAAQEERKDVAAELMRRRVGAQAIADACGLTVHAVRRWLFLRSKAETG